MSFCFIKKLLFISVICCFSALYPVFYRGTIYERFNEQMQGEQYVILLSDIDFSTKELNLPQIISMERLFNTFEKYEMKDNIALFATDRAFYQGNNRWVQFINNKHSVYYLAEEELSNKHIVNPLLSLVKMAKERKFYAINLEHHFLRNNSIDLTRPLLGNAASHSGNVNDYCSKYGLTTKVLAEETFTTLKQYQEASDIRRYKLQFLSKNSQQAKDLEIVEKQWQSFKDNYENQVKEQYTVFENYDGTLYQFLNEKIESEDHHYFLSSLTMLDLDLIGIKALDGIAHSDKKKIIIAAGGLPIRELEPVLEQMGFNWIGQEGKELNDSMDDVNDAEVACDKNYTDFQAKVFTAKTVEDIKNIMRQDVTIVSDDFFAYIAFLGEKTQG